MKMYKCSFAGYFCENPARHFITWNDCMEGKHQAKLCDKHLPEYTSIFKAYKHLYLNINLQCIRAISSGG